MQCFLFLDIYNKTHGAKYSKCSNKWNPIGDGLTEENIPFPIFFLKNATERDEFINVSCFILCKNF